jgi:hypothetical protein
MVAMIRTLFILVVASGAGGSPGGSASSHWAYQPVRNQPPPAVKDEAWVRSPVDRFILAKLEANGLRPSIAADRRTLLRRATYDLIGLPPTPAEIDNFLNDTSPDAFNNVVQRLLDSPHFGERWGRYWLDIARYADTKGYIFTEERKFPYSYTYRDWVVRALNEDLPYDQFLIEQIAADQLVPGDDKRSLAALGFVTLGRRFLGNTHDIIDDRIDVVTRGTMAMTVQCARCHDHKYDPIPQADYYSLYGIFASCSDKELPIAKATPEFESELQKREAELNEFQDATLSRTLQKLRTRVSEYLLAAESLKDHPDIQDFMFVDNPGDINRFALGRWRTYLETHSKRPGPVWGVWYALAAIPEADFAKQAPELTRQVLSQTGDGSSLLINPLVAAAFAGNAPTNLKDTAERYGRLFAEVEQEWQDKLTAARSNNAQPPAKLDDPAREQLREVLYGSDSPTAVPRRRIDDLFEKPDADKLRTLRKNVQDWRTSTEAPPNAMALVDNESAVNPAIFLRGNPANRGANVPRQFLGVLAGHDRKPFQHGSGRLELARAIASPDNPLTARVMANRVWMHLFGNGLVRTPSDFGLRSDPPTHPELLDWLATSIVENGWSIKQLIRRVMLSNTYQMSSTGPDVTGQLAETPGECAAPSDSGDSQSPAAVDPENRLLWRQNRRRLDFESMRDSLLAVSGDLDSSVGGTADDLAKQPFSRRRTIYGFIERQNLPGMLRTFDFASPDTHCPQRFMTTVPQQALFLMNSPFVAEQSQRLAARRDVLAENDSMLRVQRLYRWALGRPASIDEARLAVEFVESAFAAAEGRGGATMDPWEQLAQILLLCNEFIFVD